jgi:regulatory protein
MSPVPGRRDRREGFAEKRARLAAVEDPNVVLEAALRFLEPRQRSVGEVMRRLTTAGYRVELIDGAIEKLISLEILDDEAFARTWLESRDRAHPRGERALRRELQVKGIAKGVVDDILGARRPERGGDPDPDVTAAERLLARNRHTLERVADPRARRQRAYALLARNGFDSEIASRLSATVVDGATEAGELDQA